jgi:citrate lyase beta subunit
VAAASTSGVAVLDGVMVDAVHLRMARQVLDRAAANEPATPDARKEHE